MEKRQHLQQMLLGKLDICTQETETTSMSVQVIYSQWIDSLNIRPETLKLFRKEQEIPWNF
jgi:hypothetical protein